MLVHFINQKVRLPDFFIVGAAKSATTSLFSYLKQHPKIFLPERKEMYFMVFNGLSPRLKLTDGTYHPAVGCTREEYFETYKNSPEGCLLGDVSTWYLYFHETVIPNIIAFYGDEARKVKIIMVLRNPIERAWSHYCMHQRTGIIDIPFLEAITDDSFKSQLKDGYYPSYDYIGFGMYYRQVKAYMDAFDDVKVFLFEDLRNNALEKVKKIIQFLDVEPVGNLETGKRLNVSGTPKSSLAAAVSHLIYKRNVFKKIIRPLLPRDLRYKLKMEAGRFLFKKNPLKPEHRQVLIDIYRDDILRLQKLLDRDLSQWL
ncbi:MAG: sulfotransferase [Candidatus Aminicenantes bacterium]|jgi:hypothetical protein